MRRTAAFFKRETVLCITAALAIISMFAQPPTAAYLNYINWPVLIELFCLMAVVAGFKSAGLLDLAGCAILNRTRSARYISLLLTMLCFFVSMAVTNDVALLTFVPLTVQILGRGKESRLIFVVALEAAAANLGSMVTPVGNPQNLFLYSYYNMSPAGFFSLMLPVGAVSLVLCVLALLLFVRRGEIQTDCALSRAVINRKRAYVLAVLFVICLLAVLRVFSAWICLALVAAVIFVTDRKSLLRVDYCLLLTFVSFFIFAGNLRRIPEISSFLSGIMAGRELLVTAAASQVISNVPAAMMLSPFTSNAGAVLLGTDVGGLGTPVASLASLIALKLYGNRTEARPGRYILVFLALNFAMLAILYPIASLLC